MCEMEGVIVPEIARGQPRREGGQVIDRAETVEFTFEGRKYTGYRGDTIASALYRAGIRVFSRSFKYHRPRGLLCVSGCCPNCLVNVDSTPNVRACITRLEPGMQVKSQNAWPSLEHDLMGINDSLDRFLPVGFYYKSFIRPRSLWPVYETVLRHAAGLGVIDPDPERSQERYFDKQVRFADVAVVGGGPAGMAAALAAAGLGAQVVVVDENPQLGGHLRYSGDDWGPEIWGVVGQIMPSQVRSSRTTHELVGQLADAVYAQPNIHVLSEAVAFGWYEGNLIGVAHGQRLVKLRTSQLVVASGQIEQPLVFHNNDLPGVFLGSGLQRLVNLYGVQPGERALIVTANDAGWAVARDLLDAGTDVAMVVDARPKIPDTNSVSRVQSAGVPAMASYTIVAAKGDGRVAGAILTRLGEDGRVLPGTQVEVACDLVALSPGFIANNALLYQSGCNLRYDDKCGNFVPIEFALGVHGAGHAIATQGLAAILLEGQVAGLDAALSLESLGEEKPPGWQRRLEALKVCQSHSTLHPLVGLSAAGNKKFVCLCEDVTEGDIQGAVLEGYDDIETLKRYTTVSMGPCQGKMCSTNLLRLCARETQRTISDVGTTTSRPPFKPVKFGILAGRQLEPVRYSPMHRRHLALGATMTDAGQWKRPQHYGDPYTEVKAVRERAGLIDVSTLGKIDVQGPDALRFLERVYTNKLDTLGVGRIRYGVMCTQAGVVFDDGVVCRLDDQHYYLTTTSSGVESVYEWLTWWLADWRWQVHVTDMTASYAAVNLAGPRSRDVLAKLTESDLSGAGFPYMHVREARLAGVPAHLLRIGFVGELSFEIHCSAEYGDYVWDILMEAGSEFGISPFGLEAQRILRLEKKHIIVGQDTDALSDPFGADMSWVVNLDKDDFIGKPSLERIRDRGPREQLVGFEMQDTSQVPAEGEQIVDHGRLVGRVTSARYSPTLDKSIGMGWVTKELAYEGAVIQIRSHGKLVQARVGCGPFYDPDGKRLRM
jgi:sarcosine oxidase subunit alpha